MVAVVTTATTSTTTSSSSSNSVRVPEGRVGIKALFLQQQTHAALAHQLLDLG